MRAKFSSIGSNVQKYQLIFKTNEKLTKTEKQLIKYTKSVEKKLILQGEALDYSKKQREKI